MSEMLEDSLVWLFYKKAEDLLRTWSSIHDWATEDWLVDDDNDYNGICSLFRSKYGRIRSLVNVNLFMVDADELKDVLGRIEFEKSTLADIYIEMKKQKSIKIPIKLSSKCL